MSYKDFKNKYLGKKVDYDGAYGAQCWDLAEQYVVECLELPASILAGCGVVNNLLKEPKISVMKEYFDVIPLDKKQPGDIEVFDFGHIAIMDHWDETKKVNYYLSQNTGTAENPKGGVEILPIYDNQNCMAFRKKGSDTSLEEVVVNKKTNEELADEVIQGKWGNYPEREQRLTEAGYSYSAVQAIVNQKMAENKKSETTTSNDDILLLVKKTIRGNFGNGDDRRKALGDKYNEVQYQVDLNYKNGTTRWDNIRLY